MPLKILVSCATSAVTSTLMMDRIQQLARKEGLTVEVYKCLGQEIKAKVKSLKPVVIVTTLAIKTDYGIPTLSGIPYLTGIGADILDQKILDLLKKSENA